MAAALDSKHFAAILDGLYRGVEDPEVWANALIQIGEALRAPVIALHTFDLVEKTGVAVGISGVPLNLEQTYNAGLSRLNVWMGRARGRIVAGGIVVSDDLLPEDELLSSDWYEEILRPLGIHRSIGAVVAIERNISDTILFGRPRSHGPYQEEDRRLLLSLVPHLQNVQRVRRRIAALDAEFGSLSSMLDALGHGVLLGEPDGRVSFLNPAARSILDLRDGLTLRADGLHAAVCSEDEVLRHVIGHASARSPAAGRTQRMLKISRPSGARPFEVLVLPLPSSSPVGGPSQPGTLILLHDPDSTPHSAVASLRAAFGLTPAEALVAELVAEGMDLATVAAKLQIALDTARTHLKRVFAKTNTHRQAELSRLLTGSLTRMGER